MAEPDQAAAAAKAAAVYNAASDHYGAPALGFWERFGVATVSRLGLQRGARVLDLCCGGGASALAAARAVGPGGHVVGIDLSERLLTMAAARAQDEGLTNVEFHHGDATSTGLPSASFDAVVCVFGVFFAADRTGFVREMWRQLRPRGTLAITTWGHGLFEPAISVFWQEVAASRPDLHRAYNPWDDLTTVEAVAALLRDAGVLRSEVAAEAAAHELDSPADFWEVMLGSGYRGTLDAMSGADVERVRAALLEELQRREVRSLRADVVYATAVRPGH
jgi:ubiquinone/menaquinone biosynthesis C-methylase UbiE